MGRESFEALVAEKNGGEVNVGVRRIGLDDLPEGEVLIRARYSSVNYKDALACMPEGNVAKQYPLVPGIDLAGIVEESRDERFQPGEEVLVTGYGLGVSHHGGYASYARVPASWVVKLPRGLSLRESMILGTAGFTAALSVHELRAAGVRPEDGPVLVTGASGGVGSLAVSMLAKLGYEVAASTGKPDMQDLLVKLGASRILPRGAWVSDSPRPLEKQQWAGAVDCVGGDTLAAILSSLRYGGAVAASGLTGGTSLPTTVFPFILRGVRLIGIDSVLAPMEVRERVWDLLASSLKPAELDAMHTEIGLEQVPEALRVLQRGESRGRYLVKLP